VSCKEGARGSSEAADFYYLVSSLHHIERGLGVLMFIYCTQKIEHPMLNPGREAR
jgi:hypothetical protein